MKRMLAVTLLLVGCSEPPPPAQCAEFSRVIDESLRFAAYEIARGESDNSAIRDTVRELRTSNYLATISLQVALMAQNKCPPIKEPIAIDAYLPPAKACFDVLAKWRNGDPYPVPACNVKEWKKPAPGK